MSKTQEGDDVKIVPDESAEEFSRRKRLEEIFNAREHFAEAHDRLFAARADREITDGRGEAYLLRVVQNYISLVEPIIRHNDTTKDYWSGVNIGTISVPPPDYVHELHNDPAVVMESDKPEPIVESVVGLGMVMNLPNPVQKRFPVEVKSPMTFEPDPERLVTKTTVPESVAISAFRVTNQAVHELGLGPQFSNQDGDAEIPDTYL